MLNLSLGAIQGITSAKSVHAWDADQCVNKIFIDSREKTHNGLFVALKGEHVDGHDFLESAKQNGAVAALVSKEVDASLPQLLVDDVQKSLVDIAKFYRLGFKGQMIAITGSSGKTTTKEMLACILSEAGKVCVTQGNRNNELGVPLTLLDMDAEADYFVVEMGAAQIGDIAYLMSIADPDISTITNIGNAHVGRFGSVDNISIAKSEIYNSLHEGGVAVVNVDDAYSSSWKERLDGKRVLGFSIESADADVCASNVSVELESSVFDLSTSQGSVRIELAVAGLHNVKNALCAAACACAAGVTLQTIKKGLELYQAFSSRMQLKESVSGVKIIDDTYNANLASFKAGIDVLSLYKEHKVLVVGDMAELGEQTESMHAEVGLYARNKGIDTLISVGDKSLASSKAFGADAVHFNNQEEAFAYLLEQLGSEGVVLLKGSRSAGLEKMVNALEKGVWA